VYGWRFLYHDFMENHTVMLTERQLFFKHLAQTSPDPLALEIVKAEGLYLYSSDGRKYIDMISGISVSNTGHRHPEVTEAVRRQLDKYMHLMVYGEYILSPQVKLATKLAGILPANLNSVYLVNSGSEAVEGALKLAKKFTGRTEIAAFINAYHGSTQGSLSVMGNEDFKRAFRPLLPGIRFLKFNHSDDLKNIDKTVACVIVEPVQGEAGVIVPEEGFLNALREKCNETGTLLIFDEVQTGFGRTGKMFAMEKFGVIPDIIILAKGMGGGMPVGAFVASEEIMSSFMSQPALGHITTFGGHPVCCAAAVANIAVIENEKLAETVTRKEKLFRQLLVHPLIREVRCSGLLIAVDLGDAGKVKSLITACLVNGLILDWFLFNDRSLRIAPPLIITESEIREACSVIIKCLSEIQI